jgi:molybdate transport system substrate-binding protein
MAGSPARPGIRFVRSCAVWRLLAALVVASTAVLSCGDDDGNSASLTVFAAASLTDAFNEIGQQLETDQDLSIEFNFASSSALRTQIDEGAPADVFASADRAQMELAQENGSVAGDSQVFTHNVPVIVVPSDNPAGIDDAADLAADDVTLVLAAEDVPIGRYAREIIANLDASGEYGEDYEEAVLDNVVSNEADVRAVLAKIELGEADAGIVYVTDAQVSDDVETVELPEEHNVIAEYPIAIVADSENKGVAQRFIDFILSDEGQAILRVFGFQPID